MVGRAGGLQKIEIFNVVRNCEENGGASHSTKEP